MATSGLTRYDAKFFLHIAKHGYDEERTLAFFPLFPLILKFGSEIFEPVFRTLLNETNSMILTGLLFNGICFMKATDYLFMLTRSIFNSERKAYKAGLFFCLSPISVFFSALYTEALYACLTFGALYHLDSQGWSSKTAVLLLLASSTRVIICLNSIVISNK